MTFIHYAKQQMHIKLLCVGATQVGKTANLKCLAKAKAQNPSQDLICFGTASQSPLYFQFLSLPFKKIADYHTRLHIYTWEYMPEMPALQTFLLKGVDGIVFVIDSQKETIQKSIMAFDTLTLQLNKIGIEIQTLPFVFQYNMQDKKSIFSHQELDAIFNAAGHPSFSAIAIEGKGVESSFDELTHCVCLKLKKFET